METKRPQPAPPSSFFLLPSAISDSTRHELTLDLRVLIAFKFEAGSHSHILVHTTHSAHTDEGLADVAHLFGTIIDFFKSHELKIVQIQK